MSEPSPADITHALGKLEGTVTSQSAEIFKRLTQLESEVRDLRKVANMGKGAMWLALKLGGGLAIFGAAGAWAWSVLKELGK